MERRKFLSGLTAGLVAPAITAEAAQHLEQNREKLTPTAKRYRERLLEEIQSRFGFVQNYGATTGDLALLRDIMIDWECGGETTERTLGICYAIDVNLEGHMLSRVLVAQGLRDQVEAVAESLEAWSEKHPKDHWSGHIADYRDEVIGAVAAFCAVAKPEQVEALGKAISRHYAKL
jgi:hypothetical protein